MSRVYNFSAGPAVLPEEVLREAAEEMLDYRPNLWQKARWGFKSDYLDKIRSVLPQSLRKFLRKIKQVMR